MSFPSCSDVFSIRRDRAYDEDIGAGDLVRAGSNLLQTPSAFLRASLRASLIAMLGVLTAGRAGAAEAPTTWTGTAPAAYAQALVEQTLARHSDLRILAFHVAPPGRTDNMIVASNIGRIGKVADSDDLAVIRTGAPRAERTKIGYSVELVLFDAKRRSIGALATTFADTPGVDEQALVRRAAAVRDEVAAVIPDLASLFGAGSAVWRPNVDHALH